MKKWIIVLMMMCMMASSNSLYAKAKKTIEVPNSVVNISKENTYPNPMQDLSQLEASEMTKELMKSAKINIENPRLIKMLNESSIRTTPLGIGYRANVFLGEWPLYYESEETNVNWEYYQVNENVIDNRGQAAEQQLYYQQQNQIQVEGGLTAHVSSNDDVEQMMMAKAAEKTKLPLSFHTVIGQGTKKNQVYHVEPGKIGHLITFVPAVHEKGKITYGEVYLILKGNKKSLLVKNVTKQGIGARIPIQDHLSFQYQVHL